METTPNSPEAVPPVPPLPPLPSLPPPPPPAPPRISAPPASKPRRSWGWMVAAIILTVLLVLSLFGNLTQLITGAFSIKHGARSEGFGGAHSVGPKLDEVLLKDNHSANKIAVITVDGVITGQAGGQSGASMVDVLQAELDRAAEDRRVKAVILKVDSPGGEVLASDEIYRAIRDFQDGDPDEHARSAHRGKPVICSMGSLAASGGYYVSSGCRWIVANQLTLTGSIGVIMHGWNYRGLMDKVGLEPMVYKSGRLKDMLSGERATNEIPPEERALVQSLIDETYGRFTNVVLEGRSAAHELNKKDGQELATNWLAFADGRVVSGREALELGLVDELGNFDVAVEQARKLVHIDDCNLVEYRERYELADLLSMFGQSSESHEIKLQLDTGSAKLRAGLPYFLYQP
jgi:protease-4